MECSRRRQPGAALRLVPCDPSPTVAYRTARGRDPAPGAAVAVIGRPGRRGATPLSLSVREGPPGRGAEDDELERGQLVGRRGVASPAAVRRGLRAEQDRRRAGGASGEPDRPVAEVE